MKEKLSFIKYALLIFPLIFLWVGLNFDRDNYPNDPEYIYLMNALCICDGQAVGHIDNPGTTLMQVGAGTIAVMHLLSNTNNETIIQQSLKEPNKFIEGIRKVIIVLNTLFLLLLGWIVYKKVGSIWKALFFQTSTLISTYILDVTWAKLSPEPLLFFVTGIYSILVFLYYHEEEKNKWRYVILFALITGAGLGTKATFLPLSIFPLFVLPTVKKKIYYLLGIVPSFVLFTIPAIPEYDRMYFWFRDMISHSGIYGSGSKSIIDTSIYFPNIRSILFNNPTIPVILLTGGLTLFAGYFFRKQKSIVWDLKFLAGLLSTFIFGTLLVAKHYGGDHYIMPVILLAGITLYIIIQIIVRVINSKTVSLYLHPGIVLIFIVFIALNHPKKIKTSNREYKEASEEISSTTAWVNQNYADYNRINYYIYSINKFTGLKFGNDFAKRKLLSYLKNIYPNIYFYELSSNTYFNWHRKTSLHDIIKNKGNKILLMNAPSDRTEIEEIEKLGFPLKEIYAGNAQNIYILDTLKYIPPPKERPTEIESIINCNMDEFTSHEKSLLGSNNEEFGSTSARSNDYARSGVYSLKLNKKHAFAIDYSINDVKTDEMYEIDVWRKSSKENGFLVVFSKNKTYYQAEYEAIETDKNGWDLLRIKIKISSELNGEDLIINLWNERRRPVYFDDLTIKRLIYVSSE